MSGNHKIAVMRNSSLLTSTALGVLMVAIAAGLWGLGGVICKTLILRGIEPFSLAQCRMASSALVVFLWMVATKPVELKLQKKHLPMMIFLGVGGATLTGCYMGAITHLPVAVALLLHYMGPLLVALYAWLFRGEVMNLAKMGALALAFVGCYFVVGGPDAEITGTSLVGAAFGIATAFAFAWYCLTGESAGKIYSPMTTLFYGLLFAGITWSIVQGPLGWKAFGLDPVSWSLFVFLVVFCTAFPYGLFMAALRIISATRASIVCFSEPIAGGLFAFIFLGESLGFWQLLGGALVLSAVAIVQKNREKSTTPFQSDGEMG